MDINHIRLSAELIANLYPEVLVAEKDIDQRVNKFKTGLTQNMKDPGYSCLGKNLLSICFLVNCPEVEFIPDDQFVFLQKILVACKLSLEDIALINTNRTPVEWQVLKTRFQPKIVFFWGDTPAITGLKQNFPDMTISTWENIQILPVMQSELMSRDNPKGPDLKRNLWISLKKLFNL
jgi:hypothetical protein